MSTASVVTLPQGAEVRVEGPMREVLLALGWHEPTE